MLNVFSWWRKYSLCWAFKIESMWVSHFSSWEMVVPRNLNDSTAVTVLFMMVSGGRAGGVLLKSSTISTVLSVSSSRWLTFTFTFMHLGDAFIQSDLHCIQVTVSTFYQLLLSLGIEPMILALLTPCSTSWAGNGKMYRINIFLHKSINQPQYCSKLLK